MCAVGALPLGSAGGGLHLEGWVILVHPSHKAYRADIKRSPGQRSQAAGANVLLWATSEDLLACLGHLDGCGVAGSRQAGDQQSSHGARALGVPSLL